MIDNDEYIQRIYKIAGINARKNELMMEALIENQRAIMYGESKKPTTETVNEPVQMVYSSYIPIKAGPHIVPKHQVHDVSKSQNNNKKKPEAKWVTDFKKWLFTPKVKKVD